MIDDHHQLQTKKYTSLKDYYPIYLKEHQNTMNRILHFTGTGLIGLCFITAMLFHEVVFFAMMPVTGFGLPLIGHYVFERNRPAPLKYFFLSFICNFILFGDLMMGRQPFKVK